MNYPLTKRRLRQVGSFQILKKLGEGAMATVYQARHIHSGQIVALKIAAPFLTLDPALVRRFQREFTAASHLEHPNLVRVMDCGEANGALYQVQEYVPGQSLDQRIREQQRLPPGEAVPIFLNIAEGLGFLHHHRILHRDIKPANILLHEDGSAKLGDFGLLKDQNSGSSLTRSHEGLGTLEYGAPEQFENAKHVDQRCDLYALAASFYSALTGVFPFGKGGRLIILRRKLLNQFVPLGQMAPAVSPPLAEFIRRSLQATREARPASCAEFIAALRGQSLVPGTTAAKTTAPAKPGLGQRNRRASERLGVSVPITCEPLFEGKRGRLATVVDLSRTGVCLQFPGQFNVSDILQMNLPGEGNGLGSSYLVRVLWVKSLDPILWALGCEFVEPLSKPKFEALHNLHGQKSVLLRAAQANH